MEVTSIPGSGYTLDMPMYIALGLISMEVTCLLGGGQMAGWLDMGSWVDPGVDPGVAPGSDQGSDPSGGAGSWMGYPEGTLGSCYPMHA